MPVILGMDESNHGRSPEIIVACTSNNIDAMLASEQKIKLIKNPRSITEVIGDTPFFYYRVYADEMKKAGGYQEIKTIIFADSILRANPQYVVIDGLFPTSVLDCIEGLIWPMQMPHAIFMAQGDEHIPLVNKADSIAYALWVYHTAQGHSARKSHYKAQLVTADIEGYVYKAKKMGLKLS